jgi:D-aminopeptidase
MSKKIFVEFDEKRIDAIFAGVNQCDLPGVAVGIGTGGKPVYRKGFGLANMELPVALSPSIRMRIYSTTKHFVCLAYMLLCEEGKADIDDLIGKYLPELHPVSRNASMRRLMGHTSGLRDVQDICLQFQGTGLASEDYLSLYREIDDINSAPGTTWNYNNGGYLMLSAVIERIADKPLEDVLRERIFEPTGMHDTMLRRRDTDFVRNSATMHMTTAEGGFVKSYLGNVSGEGGVVSTVNDMLRWLAHLDAPIVGTAVTWRLMKEPQILANGTSTGYGLGLFLDRYRGVATLHHGGGGLGANSQMLKVPEADLDIAVMVNRHDVSAAKLTNQIIDACVRGLEPVRGVSGGATATGVFLSPATGRVVQLYRAEKSTPYIQEGQQLLSLDGTDMPFEPGEDGVLKPAGPTGMFKLAVMLEGNRSEPESIRLTEFGHRDSLVRQPPANELNGGAIAGSYRSDITATEATISHAENSPRLRTVGRFGSAQFALECLTDGVWRAKSMSPTAWGGLGGILSFDARKSAFHFSSVRTSRLLFRR